MMERMSTKKKTVLLALAILLVIEICFAVWEYILRPNANLCENPYGITIHCKDEALLQECVTELDKLPDGLMERFKEDGWALWIGDSYLADVRRAYRNEEIMGMTRPVGKEILVSGADQIAHEFGHFVYTVLGEPEDFRQVYEQEATKAYLPSYCTADAHEYFAQGFACCVNGIDAFADADATRAYFSRLHDSGWV